MFGPLERMTSRKRGIYPLRLKAGSDNLFLCSTDCCAECRLNFIADGVDQLPDNRTLIRRQGTQTLHQSRQFTFSSEQTDAYFLKLFY